MNKKECTICRTIKLLEDFYPCKGRYRSECKKCTIKKNVSHQRKVQAWKNRYIDPEHQRTYMNQYYAKNKLKFAEYRKRFKAKHPDYYKNYARQRKIDLE